MSYYSNPNREQLKLSFLAPSGYGKTTAVKLLEEEYSSCNLKLAKPLYDMQKDFYKRINIVIKDGQQDGELLQFLGNKIQREYPSFLADAFYKELKIAARIKTTIITNDDCRPHNYQFLSQMGFIFVRIDGFRRDRMDISPFDFSNNIEWGGDIPCDYNVSNRGGLEVYRKNLRKLVTKIVNEKKEMLYYPN